MKQNKLISHLGGWIDTIDSRGDKDTWAPEIWDNFIGHNNIYSIVDIGCGRGYSTKYFSDCGIESVGIEGDPRAIETAVFKGKIILNDYTVSSALTDKDKFDLCYSCEFVEHVEEKYVDNFLYDFAKCKYVAFTHALPGQGGFHHVNEQNDIYWINKMQDIGYQVDLLYSIDLRKLVENKKHGKWMKTLLWFYK